MTRRLPSLLVPSIVALCHSHGLSTTICLARREGDDGTRPEFVGPGRGRTNFKAFRLVLGPVPPINAQEDVWDGRFVLCATTSLHYISAPVSY